MEQRGSQCMDFHEILYLRIFLKYVQTAPVSLKFEKNKRCIYGNTCPTLLRMSNVSDNHVTENQKTLLCSVTVLENRAFCKTT